MTLTRRERLREEMLRQIQDIAGRHLAEQGPAALSLRAIAREIGVTPGALYGYYASRDELLTVLVTNAITTLAESMERARDDSPADPAARLTAVGWAYRDWALRHRADFRLVFGDPIPNYQAPPNGQTVVAARRAGDVLLGIVADALRHGGALPKLPRDEAVTYQGPFGQWLAHAHTDLTQAGVAFHLRAMARLHGLISMEVYGQLSPLVTDAAPLYRAELRLLVAELGLPTPPPRRGAAQSNRSPRNPPRRLP
jgi:AcrR family transcriptional regulator